MNLAVLWMLVNGVVFFGYPFVGGAVLGIGIIVIWLRGYLVPFTPRFAPKLVAMAPVPTTWFHDTHEAGTLSQTDDDVEQRLADLARAGVVEVGERAVYLDETFEQRWHEEMDRLSDLALSELAESLAEIEPVPGVHSVEEDDQQWIAVDGQGSLVPRHVAVAELGASRALQSVIDDPKRRLAMARPLREFLTECPVCGSPFERSTEVACCGGHTMPRDTPRETLVCPTCEQRFLLLPAVDDE